MKLNLFLLNKYWAFKPRVWINLLGKALALKLACFRQPFGKRL